MSVVIKKLIDNFGHDYNSLIKSYVSRKDYENFYKKYSSFFIELERYKDKIDINIYNSIKNISALSYEDFQKHNKKVIDRQLYIYKDYFDKMYTKYGENIYLDEEQRSAILADDDYSLIIAGAGSGKTTTMAAKVKYLVDIKKIDPKEIVILSYTRKAVNELKNRINQVFKIDANITTFHSLALHIITEETSKPSKIFTEKDQKQIIIDYMKNVLFKDKEKLKLVTTIYKDCFAKEFLDSYYNFDTFEDYFEDYKRRKYEKEKGHLSLYIKSRMENLLSLEYPIGLDLNIYKSKTEAMIANFLYINSIDYKYERPYFEKVGVNQIYRPDFTCFIHGKEVYLEYFGITKYHDLGLFSKEEIDNYNKNKELKINEFIRRKDSYITLERDDKNDELLFLELRDKLKKHGFELIRKSDKEIFDNLINEYVEAEFFLFVKRVLDVINNIKETSFITEKFLDEFKDYLNFKYKDQNERTNKLLESKIILEIYDYYNKELKRKNAIDFSDMITNAYFALKNKYDNNDSLFKYLLIDEYQDISKKRFMLVRQIADIYNAKIVAVGDDWQTIYTFAGSNIELFYNFKTYLKESEFYKITNTYRNSQELINTAGEFVLKNKRQIPKSLISDKHFENPIEIVLYDKIEEFNALCQLLDELGNTINGESIAILTRINRTIKEIKRDTRFKEGPNNTLYYLPNKNLKIEILTMHSAKGMTFDKVIVIDLRNEVFPTKGYSKSALTDFIEKRDIHEYYPFAEERRLFYVALTRTKSKVYLLTPFKKENRSNFILEIENMENVVTREIVEII